MRNVRYSLSLSVSDASLLGCLIACAHLEELALPACLFACLVAGLSAVSLSVLSVSVSFYNSANQNLQHQTVGNSQI